ncbi:MAG: sulfite exporter TauE/SafE family protein [Colwellia sp.]
MITPVKSTWSKTPLNIKKTAVFITFWLSLIYMGNYYFDNIFTYYLFSFLGVIGAIFANSTGAGGGVIFIPFFNQLNFSESQSVATSFAIQCFGMTAGALTWFYHYKEHKTSLRLWCGFKRIIAITSIASLMGLGFVFLSKTPSPASLHISFSYFSLLLGFFIICTVLMTNPLRERSQLYAYDYLMLALIGLFGGAITAWLSVGVGELLVIYLLLRRFDVTMAVAAAVIVSAISVWCSIGHVKEDVYWQVIIFAGPSAILGGIFAKTVVTYLSARKLKLFFSFWLLISGAFGLV